MAQGMALENALAKPVRCPAEYDVIDPSTGEPARGTIGYLSERFGMKERTVYARLARGMAIQEAWRSRSAGGGMIEKRRP